MDELTASQRAALLYVTQYARTRKDRARRQLDEVLRMSNISREEYEDAVEQVKTHARIALHFHPDRPDADLKPIAAALLEHGVYKSQFETGLSNGSVSAFAGGERDEWERAIFGGAYHGPDARHQERPKYGALDLMRHPDGPSPRFGSCYFVLRPEVSRRATYTYLDSHYDPPEKGTYEELDDISSALFVEAFVRDFAIGEAQLTPARLVRHLRSNLARPYSEDGRAPARNLNHYIEAQVHGDVSLARDVERLVADPSFRGSQIEELFRRICSTYDITLSWHPGFALRVDAVPDDFRGPAMPSLAKRVAGGRETFDVAMIGAAAMDLRKRPEAWLDRGTRAEVLQELKLLWHVLVKLG